MTVKQLINKLSKYPSNSKVFTEIDYDVIDPIDVSFVNGKVWIDYTIDD